MSILGSESSVRLLDVDSDGILDIIVGVSPAGGISDVLKDSNLTVRQMCRQKSKF